MMDSWSNYNSRSASASEQFLYDHIFEFAETLSPEDSIRNFRKLFVEGVNYPHPDVRLALEKTLANPLIDREFKFILNRSCYILINRWLMNTQLRNYVPELVEQFEIPASTTTQSRVTRRLRELVRQFIATEQYLALKHLAQLIQAQNERSQEPVVLGHLINRYPCLYEYALLTDDSDPEQRQRIRTLKAQAQQQYETDLTRYLAYRKRQQMVNRVEGISAQTDLQLPQNPTLLSDRQFDQAIHFFTGRIDGSNTHRDLAKQFVSYSQDTRCYRTFKEELYSYLIAGIDPRYGKRQFNQSLYRYLESLLPQNDAHRINDVLLVTTCRKLLSFLIVESVQQPQHFILTDLSANMGITPTIGLLLRIVLICKKVRSYLEKRFAILFSHYENYSRQSVGWLVEALENLNIALTTHFGSINLIAT